MPSALHPQAKFDPIPPDLDLSALVEKTPNFDYVVRISTEQIRELGLPDFEKLVLLHVIIGGKPLVVEGWKSSLPPWLFSKSWLEDNVGKKQENVRDIGNSTDMPMTIGHYLNSLEKLTKQWMPTNFRDAKRQRLYLKDIDCPGPWHQHLQNVIPQSLFYLNECAGDNGGPGALLEHIQYHQPSMEKGIAPAGDLMSSLPPDMRAQNMMCYIGHEGTYTPAHREMCASLGQNIMVEASDARNGEKDGSSIWFMTESKDREVVSEYFLSMLGHDIEVENHFAQINAWKKAPFPVYIVEQKVGDFILIPPLAPHQVWNRGTRTMKVAWNRTTVETLDLALHEALPRARMVCRDEQYKNKAIIYYSLLKYAAQLRRVEQVEEDGSYAGRSVRYASRVKQLQKDFKRLFALYTEILLSEMFSPDLPTEKDIEFVPFDSNITCSYCRCNIFNRFLTCKTCIGEIEGSDEQDTYDVCMECYAMGRSCGCISNLKWVEQWQWPLLTQRYDEWRAMIISSDGFIDVETSPQPLDVARDRYGKKPVAQVCQEQLKLRPWQDITNPAPQESSPSMSDEEPEVDDEGRVKKKKLSKRKSNQLKRSHKSCHICRKSEWLWKLAVCTKCNMAYCYGSLWRAFDLKPQSIMERSDWKCPKCLKTCSCSRCLKIPSQVPYRPKGTLLGHDTRCVADPRSVESLVDFSRTNLFWLRGEGDDDPQSSHRMQSLIGKAQAEKARDEVLEEDTALQDESMLHSHEVPNQGESIARNGNMAIDPQLTTGGLSAISSETAANGMPNKSYMENDIHKSVSDGLGFTHESIPSQFSPATYPGYLDGALDDSIQTNDLVHGGFVPPTAMMLYPEDSAYPDPFGLGRDRMMMGAGYYQQRDGSDKILFDHPNAVGHEAPIDDPMLNVDYPRLDMEEEQALSGSKRWSCVIGDVTENKASEDAHIEFFQAQKKQTLAAARRKGNFYMTQNKLAGGGPLVIKLRMMSQKAFLHRLDALDRGKSSVRHNPRPSRASLRSRSAQVDSEGEDMVVVTSDVAQNEENGSRLGTSHREVVQEEDHFDTADSGEDYAPRRLSHSRRQNGDNKKGRKRPNDTVLATQRAGLKRNRDDDIPSQNHSGREDGFHSPQSRSPPSGVPGPARKRQRQVSKDDASLEREVKVPLIAVSSEPQHNYGELEAQKRSEDQEPLGNQVIAEHSTQRDDSQPKYPTPSVEAQLQSEKITPAQLPTEPSAGEENPGIKQLLARKTIPNRMPTSAIQGSLRGTISAKRKSQSMQTQHPALSDEYQSAKLMALRIAEGEMEEEVSPKSSVSKHHPPPTSILAKSHNPSKKNTFGNGLSESTKTSPDARVLPAISKPGKFLSLAEKRALQGKKIKIVSARHDFPATCKPHGTINHISRKSVGRRTAIVTKPTTIVYMGSSSQTDEESSSDGDEEIPAIRPGGRSKRC